MKLGLKSQLIWVSYYETHFVYLVMYVTHFDYEIKVIKLLDTGWNIIL